MDRGTFIPFDTLGSTFQPSGLHLLRRQKAGFAMANVVYEIVEHDGGWAYKVNNVFSEPYPTHAAASAAANRAASHQQAPGDTEVIQFEDSKGKWHEETVRGNDRPKTEVVDKA